MADVVIAGGGPAGLNAALILGRVGRPVLLADAGQPRNSTSGTLHGFFSRDGAKPAELRATTTPVSAVRVSRSPLRQPRAQVTARSTTRPEASIRPIP